MKIIHISLFTGICGFEIASSWCGWENYATCEIDDFCTKIAEYYFPESYHHRDIRTLTIEVLDYELSKRYGKDWRKNAIIVLTGGFPCQPFSISGKRKGKEDNRYLWPEFKRVISEIRPNWVIGENVAGILSMVQPNDEIEVESQTDIFKENNSKRVQIEQEYVIETICRDFECIGYTVQPIVIPACATGAPHKRDRVWFIANSDSDGADNTKFRKNRSTEAKSKGGEKERKRFRDDSLRNGSERITPDPSGSGLQGNINSRGKMDKGGQLYLRDNIPRLDKSDFREFPTQSPICSRNDGISERLDGITFPRWRSESIKSYGNAIVPQVAYSIMNVIDLIIKSNEG